MCAGAIVQARVSEVVIGSMNPKAGCAGSILNMLEMHEFNHQVKVKAAGGISSMEDAEKFLELGADRLGTSRIVKIENGRRKPGGRNL